MTPSPQSTMNRFLVDQDEAGASSGSTAISVPFRIGRMEGFDLCLPSPNVSALHAEILEEDGELWVYDLGSTNGTFVNNERVRVKTLLHDDDTIVFGNRTFRLIFSASESLNPREVMATLADGAVQPQSLETPEEKFRRLLDDGAIPFFQPVYNISFVPQKLVGYEVLGRSTMSGLRTPDKMFAAALSLAMESELSRVFRQRGIAAAQDKIPEEMKLFVNTHPAELNCDKFEDSLTEIRANFPSRPIVLELSSASLTEPDSVSHLRKLLKNLDIGLALHDFGTGPIHLAQLNEIPPEIVKFDCDLVQGIDIAGPKHLRLVQALVKMVKELGITPMAEYVESVDEHETLVQLGFEFAQGFHYGRPNDIEDTQLPIPETEVASAKLMKVETGGSKLRPAELMKQVEPPKQNSPGGIELDKVVAPGNTRDAAWLLQQQQHHYTIQLMMAPMRDSAESFLAKQSPSGQYALYRKLGKSQTWFTVVYGVFEDREQAKLEAENFKKVGISPLVRRFSSVHSEIRKASTKESAK